MIPLVAGDDWILLNGLARAHILAWSAAASRQSDWQEIVPGIDSLALKYDPLDMTEAQALAKAAVLAHSPHDIAANEAAPITLPVCYAAAFAPDRQLVADHLGIPVDALPDWHRARTYHVAMLGFLPGFAYLTSARDMGDIPRLETPREIVPSGSVGVLGKQCGLYPVEGPGGWPLIGRVAARLFDPARDPPALLSAGQQVRFALVSRDEFDRLTAP